jgi:glycosyltransferase involved in cell wall biosynthesis
MGTNPLVSVVIPLYNGGAYIGETIAGVLAQSYSPYEIIVIDDGSTDGGGGVVEAYGERLRYHRQANQGVCAARNWGVSLARGPLIAFLDQDDLWAPEKLERCVAALEGDPDACLAYSLWDELVPDEGGWAVRPGPALSPSGIAWKDLLLGTCPLPSAVVVRKEAFDACGGFCRWRTPCQDMELWLRMAPGRRFLALPDRLALWRRHPGQYSNGYVRVALDDLRIRSAFLRAHADLAAQLTPDEAERCTVGLFTQRAMDAYWTRRLSAARQLLLRSWLLKPGRVSFLKYFCYAVVLGGLRGLKLPHD